MLKEHVATIHLRILVSKANTVKTHPLLSQLILWLSSYNSMHKDTVLPFVWFS